MSDGSFVVGVWGVRVADFPAWAARGVGHFLANKPAPEGVTHDDYCHAAADAGGVAMLSPTASPAADAARRGFGGWCMPDEPEGRLPAREYEATWFALRSRGWPVFGNFTHMVSDGSLSFSDARRYFNGNTVWGFDYHIVNRGLSLEAGFDRWERVVSAAQAHAGRRKPFWVSVETGPHLPTCGPFDAATFRALNLKAKELGASGVVWFPIREAKYPGGFSWDVTPPDVAEAMPGVAEELRGPTELERLRCRVAAMELAATGAERGIEDAAASIRQQAELLRAARGA